MVSNLNKVVVSRQMCLEVCNTKFNKNSSSGSRTLIHADRHTWRS